MPHTWDLIEEENEIHMKIIDNSSYQGIEIDCHIDS